ncbi:MAG: hypothetical protein NC904_08190, partial [Candidatus Omnitrophica bacterium]|nr:hypothetical protein [Candidatus Omnitrophota bacterium]
ATTYQDDQGTEYILLSNLYPEYNTSLQRACSLVHESGATSKFNKEHIYNSLREYEFLLWAFKDVQEGQAIAKSLVPIISTKKSPGTSSLESRETLFLKELAFALHRENLSCIYDIENTLIKFIMGVWRIKNEDMNGILDKNREPVTFKERTLYLLKTGKVKFVIDDLEQANQKHLLEGLASTFGILTLPQKDDYYLYSRFKPDNDPSGVLSFLICGYMNSNGDIISEEEYKTKGEEIKKLKEGVEKNKEKDNISEAEVLNNEVGEEEKKLKAYKPYMFIHISKKLWDGYRKNHYFLAQIIIHELAERIMGSLEGVNPHQVGVIFEMFFASNEAKEIGISDLNIFLLKHALERDNRPYLNKLIVEYYPERDPSLGSFYEYCWQLSNERGWVPTEQRRKLLIVSLRDERFMKRAPATEIPLVREEKDLEERYKGKGRQENIPGGVTAHIRNKKTCGIYNPLIDDYINTGRLIFRVDDLDRYFYPRDSCPFNNLGLLFFIVPNGDKIEIHITQKLWEEKKDDSSFLSQIIIYTYIQNLVPKIEGIDIHYWAGLCVLQFASDEAIKEEVNDLDRFYLDYAKNNKLIEYLYYALIHYRIFKDPMGTFKFAVYKRLEEIDKDAELLIQKISSPEDLIAYYGYLFEYKYSNISYSQRVQKISQDLESYRKTYSVVDTALNSNYFFTYSFNNQTIYLPENIGSFIPLRNIQNFDISDKDRTFVKEFQFIEDNKNLRREKQAAKQMLQDEEQIKSINKEIKGINAQIDKSFKEIAMIYSRPFIDWLINLIREEHSKLQEKERRCLVVGIYGPSSSGKSTVTEIALKELAKIYNDLDVSGNPRGIRVNFLSADSYLYPGEGLRYERKQDKSRFTIIKGQSIYDLWSLARDINTLRKKEGRRIVYVSADPHFTASNQEGIRSIDGTQLEILLVDFPCLSIDDRILEYMDIFIPFVFTTDSIRLNRRLERDTRPKEEGGDRGDSAEYVINELADKQFHEMYDAMKYIVELASRTSSVKTYIWRQIDEYKSGIYVYKPQTSPITKTAPFTQDLTSDEVEFIESRLKGALNKGEAEVFTINDAVRELLRQRSPPELIKVLNDLEEGRVKLRALDIGPYPGFKRLNTKRDRYVYAYTTKEDGTFYINITTAFRFLFDKEFSYYLKDAIKKIEKEIATQEKTLGKATSEEVKRKTQQKIDALEKDKAFLEDYSTAVLTQIIVYEYIEAVLGLSHHRADQLEREFMSSYAQRKGLSDLDLFILDHAAKEGAIEYLFSLIGKEDIPQDTLKEYIQKTLFLHYLSSDIQTRFLNHQEAIVRESAGLALADIQKVVKSSLGEASIHKGQDIRGIAYQYIPYKQEELCYEVYYRLGRAIASVMKEELNKGEISIGVGKDVRIHSSYLQRALIEGLISKGVNVIDIGFKYTTTPMVSNVVYSWSELDGALQVTASHNDFTYNGLKIIFGKENMSEELISKTFGEAYNDELGYQDSPKGSYRQRDYWLDYKQEVIDFIHKQFEEIEGIDRERPLKGRKYAVEGVNGANGEIFVEIL